MKTSFAKKGLYVGTGAGLVIFVLFGLLPGSLLGGVAGLNIAGWLFGQPVESALLSRIIVFLFMLIGTLVSGVVIVWCAAAAPSMPSFPKIFFLFIFQFSTGREDQPFDARSTHSINSIFSL